jgi:hypothetical protein
MVRYLKDTSPWLRFLGILGYIGAVLSVVVGLILGILIALGGGVLGEPGGEGSIPAFIGPIYLAVGALLFFPARFTYRFGMKIRSYLAGNAEKDLEEALRNNRALWRFSGILVIVYLGLIPLGLIGLILSAVFSP